MKKQYNRLLLLLLLALITVLVVIQVNHKKEVDWSWYYSKNYRSPYGTYILHDVLQRLPEFSSLETNYLSTTQYMYNNTATGKGKQTFFIATRVFNPDELSLRWIMEYVKEGNTFFVAADGLGIDFSDEIDLTTSFEWSDSTAVSLSFTNPALATQKPYSFSNITSQAWAIIPDSANATILATDQKNRPVMVSVPYGEGKFILCTCPYIFTNYHLLGTGPGMALRTFSYMPGKIIWDEFNKPYRQYSKGILFVILNNEALRWSYILLLSGLFVYMALKLRRRYPRVPVISPPRNSTLDFIRTLGNLYYHRRDHKDMALKRHTYFIDYVRQKYNLKNLRDDEFFRQLTLKSGIPEYKIRALNFRTKAILDTGSISPDEFLEYSILLDELYTLTK